MTLIECPACSHNVATDAKSCPNCGKPLKTPALRISTAIWLVGLLAALIVASFSRNFAEHTMSRSLYLGTALACARSALPGLFVDAFSGTETVNLERDCAPTWFRAFRFGMPSADPDRIAQTASALRNPSVSPPVASIRSGPRSQSWQYRHHTDPATGEDDSYIISEDAPASLTVSCAGSRAKIVMLDVGLGYFGEAGSQVPVTYRFDRSTPISTRWFVAEASSIGANLLEANRFVDGAIPASQVVIRVHDRVDRSHEIEFSLLGFTAAMRRLRCYP